MILFLLYTNRLPHVRELIADFAVESLEPLAMDYRAQGSWIRNARGRPGKAGYAGSDVTYYLHIHNS